MPFYKNGLRRAQGGVRDKYSWAFSLEGTACTKEECVHRIKVNSERIEFSVLSGRGSTIKLSSRDGQEENLGELCPCTVRMVSYISEGFDKRYLVPPDHWTGHKAG